MKPTRSGMGLEDESLKPGKTKIIKAESGMLAQQEDMSPMQKSQLELYKRYKEQEEDERGRRRQEEEQDMYRERFKEYYRMPMQRPADETIEMKKGGMTKGQKKVSKVMKEFKAGKLHSGKKGPVVKNPKQAIAIALSEAGMSKKKMQSGGMVRGSGAAIKGVRKAKLL